MKTADESWRLFIALELPATLRELVRDHIDRLRQSGPDARASWVRAENLHLTLKFLGDTHVSNVDALATAVRHAASQASPFQAQVHGCAAFPLSGQPRVLWIGVDDPTGGLTRLYRALEDECAQAGFSREERSFHPHLTVARLRRPQGARHLADIHRQMSFLPTTLRVAELCLIRSELMSAGSRYTVIARHALGSE